MASQVSICNQALSMVGANLITSIDDDTTEAKVCKAQYDIIRDELLEAANWSFATKWYVLPQLATTPESEYKNAFQIPNEVIRVIFVGQDFNHPEDWQREGETIVTNQDTCKCQTVVQVNDPARFSPKFTGAFATRLGAEITLPLTNNAKMYQLLMGSADNKLNEAINSDNSQGRARKITSNWLRSARVSGFTGAGPTV